MTPRELITVVAVAAFALLLFVVWRTDRTRRRREGSAVGGVVGTFDEVFHPEAARAVEIREVQRELPASFQASPPDPASLVTPNRRSPRASRRPGPDLVCLIDSARV